MHERNLAKAGRLYNVFEVPGTFTKGTLVISGSERTDGYDFTVTAARSIPITFAAG